MSSHLFWHTLIDWTEISASWSARTLVIGLLFPCWDACPISFRPFAHACAFRVYYDSKIGLGLWQLLDGFTPGCPSFLTQLTLGRPENQNHLWFELWLWHRRWSAPCAQRALQQHLSQDPATDHLILLSHHLELGFLWSQFHRSLRTNSLTASHLMNTFTGRVKPIMDLS